MRVLTRMVCAVLLVAPGACQETRQGSSPEARVGAAPGPATESETVTGTIRHIDLEGGFYGLEADDGARLDPVNLPAEFQKDGLRVRARVQRLRDRVSIHMWGQLVRLLDIERL